MVHPVDERLDVERQVLLRVCFDVARGTYRPGERLPSPLVFANQLLTDVRTVELVYRRLSNAGILVEQPGRNYVVGEATQRARNLVAEWARSELRSLRRRLLSAGFEREEIAQMAQRVLLSEDTDTRENQTRS